jgi:hypothetical protein
MRLNKADTFSQDMEMNMMMNTSGIEMNMKMNIGTSFEVIKGDGDEKEIKLTYRNMHIAMDMGQFGKMVPDSVKNRDYNTLVGKSVVLKLSKDNEITDVTGFDEIMTNAAHDSASREMMKKMFSKDQVKSTFGMIFSMYPKKPVKVGETWSGESKINMANMDMNISNKYKLLSVKNGLAEISIDGTIGGGGEMVKSSGMKMDMSGTQKGTMIIRMDNGYLHNSNYQMDIKAEMQMMGQKIPMTMKADYIIKGN